MSFLSNFFKVQGKNIKKSINQAVVAFDPEAATEAEIQTLEDNFNELLVKLGQAQVALTKEKKEAEAARAKYNQYLAAAEKLNTQRGAGDSSQETAVALGEALQFLESFAPEVTREEQEAAEAEAYFQEIKQTAEVLRDKLLTAKKTVDSARKDMERAQMRKERAEVKAENAAALAGLRDSTSALGEASRAMLEKAEKERAAAVALETKVSLLGGAGTPAGSDLLKKTLEGAPVSDMTLEQRLAALKM